jgi:hypothetical protein
MKRQLFIVDDNKKSFFNNNEDECFLKTSNFFQKKLSNFSIFVVSSITVLGIDLPSSSLSTPSGII